MRESLLQSNIIKMIKMEFPDVWVYRTHDALNWPTARGVPDLLLCVGPMGRFAAIEVKRKNARYEALQIFKLNGINLTGGCARACATVEEARKFIESIKHGK